MDIITQRFIAMGVRIRKELSALRSDPREDVANLANRVENLEDAINAQRQSYEKRSQTDLPVAITDLRTDIPIRVEKKSDRSKIERVWLFMKGTLEVAGIIAVIAYTWISFNNWQDQADATDAAARQAELSKWT
jgi:hypothetical protein